MEVPQDFRWQQSGPSAEVVSYLREKVTERTVQLYHKQFLRFLDITRIPWVTLSDREEDSSLAHFIAVASKARRILTYTCLSPTRDTSLATCAS